LKQITWHGGTNFTVDHVDNLLPPDGWVLVKIDTVMNAIREMAPAKQEENALAAKDAYDSVMIGGE